MMKKDVPVSDQVKVSIWNDGGRIYNNLIDDGSEVIRFESGHGFVTRSQIKQERWEIRPCEDTSK